MHNFKQFFYLICEDEQFNVPQTLFDKLLLFHEMEYKRSKIEKLFVASRMIEKRIDPTIHKLFNNDFYPIFIEALNEWINGNSQFIKARHLSGRIKTIIKRIEIVRNLLEKAKNSQNINDIIIAVTIFLNLAHGNIESSVMDGGTPSRIDKNKKLAISYGNKGKGLLTRYDYYKLSNLPTNQWDEDLKNRL